MSSPAASPPPSSALALLCETAGQALRCTVHVVDAGCPDAAPAGARDLPFAGASGGGTLRFGALPDAAPWGEGERALAGSFARLAGAAADADEAARLRGRLTELERRVDIVQALASVGSYEWSVADDRIVWSPEQLRIHGLDAASPPRTFDDFVARVHPDDRASVVALMQEGMRTGRRTEARHRIVRPDGEVRVLHARSEVLPDAAGRPARVVGTSQDVTQLWSVERELRVANERLEQRVAERTAALQEREERFRRMIEHAHDLIVVMDETGVTHYGSPSVRRILGYDPDEYEGTSLVSFFHPDDVGRVTAWLAGLTAHPGETHRTEFRFRHADGHWVDLEAVSSARADQPRGAPHVINVRDVTERRRAEEALRASEARYRSLVEQLPAIIYTASVDPGNPSVFASPQAERLLGYSETEWRASPRLWLERVHEDDRARVEAEWDAAHAAGRPFAAEYRMVARDGRVLWFRDESVLLRDDAGRPLYIQGVMLDVTDRKEAERALREREERFRRLIENGSDLLIISAVDGPLLYVSPSAERLLGYAPEEMLGRVPDEQVHPEDVPAVMEVLRAAAAAPGVIHPVAFRLRHRDGSWRRYRSLARTLAPDSAAEGIVCNARDVTEQREAELALQRSEEHFRALIEHSYDLVQVLDAQGQIVYTGPSVQRLLGYTPEEIAGMTIPDFMHPDDLPAAGALVARVLADPGTAGSLEYRVRHKDDSWRWLEAWARTLSPTSAEQGLVANARDVTDRKASETALQRSEEHFRRLIENGSDLLMISAPDGPLSYVSPSAERLFGYPADEVLAWTPQQVVHPDDVDSVLAVMADVAAAPGTVHRVAWRVRHRDGSWRTIEALARTLTPDSADAGIVINGRDVTEQRAADAALRQAKADAEAARVEAERANHAKSEFLSRMSHELRTPLNSILGFAQVLEDAAIPARYLPSVRHILNGGRHLLNLINEVLDIARIEADAQPLSIEPVRVGAALREAVDMVGPLAAARGVRVAEERHASAEHHVRADRQRLVQVLLNLLSNAVKYNRPQGTVWIGCEPVRDAAGEERLRFRVRDEGGGIAPERRDELFVPFARLGAEHTGIEGTGLGLALSQRLARAMGGALLLERTGADGSTFCVDLEPAASPLAALPDVAATGDAGASDAQDEATLLYIEDNLANLSLVEAILLPHAAWRVIPALQGGLGLELAAEHAPDLVLLDLHLPDMHGRDVLRRLRADPRTARTPVVVISADATPRTVEGLLDEGADAFLTKPINVRGFLVTVERLLARARRAG